MQTHLLSDAEVGYYLADLMDRLLLLGDDFPTTWYSVGISGEKVVEQLLAHLPENYTSKLVIHRLKYRRTQGGVEVLPISDVNAGLPESALMVDGPIHSGQTMLAIARWLMAQGVKEIISYGLMVKRTSIFIPSYFGLMIGEHDRAYFQSDRIPNHRLRKNAPFGILRTIEEGDLSAEQQSLDSGVASLSEITLVALWYAHKSRGDHIYVYEHAGRLAGFVHFTVTGDRTLLLDAIAVDRAYQERGIGGMLLRWVENWARNNRLLAIDLFAILDRISWYKRYGYSELDEKSMPLGSEAFQKMRRKLLYNMNPPSPLLDYKAHVHHGEML